MEQVRLVILMITMITMKIVITMNLLTRLRLSLTGEARMGMGYYPEKNLTNCSTRNENSCLSLLFVDNN